MALGGGEFDSVVRLVGVQKYFGAVHALRDIDITIGRNEIVGLIGDNGAGKSVLIKCIAGTYEVDSGELIWEGKRVRVSSPRDAAELGMPIHPHMLRHSTGFKLANDGQDTRAIQLYLGHRNIQHTVLYTQLASDRFSDFWKD